MGLAASTLAAAVLAATVGNSAPTMDLLHPPPTPSDLYVGCYLLVHGTDLPLDSEQQPKPYSAARCSIAALNAIIFREGGASKSKLRFCLPDTADVRINPSRAMAFAYLDHFENYGRAMKDTNGPTAFVAAMILKWPCAPLQP